MAVYQEEARADTGSDVDIVLPPRFGIRRRMVREMVAMAERGYSKWFVMAHSLGSVVAFNGLMEPDYVLPNYLSEKHWDRLKGTQLRSETSLTGDQLSAMRPRRPHWLAENAGVSREKLFERLAGFVTYGSPLHLFARLWPNTVPLNLRCAFSRAFKWVNVHSPLDPFSGALRPFVRKGLPAPCSHLYTGSWRAFVAHAEYLHDKKRGMDFCRALGRWFFAVSDFRMEHGVGALWARLLAILQTIGASLAVAGVAVLVIWLLRALVLGLIPGGEGFQEALSELLHLEFEWRGRLSLSAGSGAD